MFYKTDAALTALVKSKVDAGAYILKVTDGLCDYNDKGFTAFKAGFEFAQKAKDKSLYGVEDGDYTYLFVGDLKAIKAKVAAL
jgi:hypothetical protein